MTRRTREAGFTLLEILVALVVLGFLLVGLSEGTRFGLRAWDTETRLVERQSDLDGADRLLRGLVAQAAPGAPNDPPPFHGEKHRVEFLTRLPVAGEGLPTRDAEVALGVDQQHRLVLRWAPRPHAERLTPAAPPRETVLLEGLDHIDVSYARWPEQGGGWVDTWDLPSVPALVRITLAFPKDDRRHWPVIETAPMNSRLTQ